MVVTVYSHKPGVDYLDSFAPVARMDTKRILIILSAQMKWKILHLDVISVLQNGFLEGKIY